MNRCLSLPTPRHAAWRIGLIATLLCLCTVTFAQEKVRPFPPKAQRGEMQMTNPPDMLIDGKPERLSPGARIRGTNNMVVMSGAIIGPTFTINYVRESHGLIHEVWILNATEAQTPLPAP
jgi:hypothetical protein